MESLVPPCPWTNERNKQQIIESKSCFIALILQCNPIFLNHEMIYAPRKARIMTPELYVLQVKNKDDRVNLKFVKQ